MGYGRGAFVRVMLVVIERLHLGLGVEDSWLYVRCVLIDRLVDGRAARSVKGFIRAMAERRSPLDCLVGFVCLSQWRSSGQNCVLEAPRGFHHFICYSAMHDMNTGLGCSFLIHTKEACKAFVSGIKLFGGRISM